MPNDIPANYFSITLKDFSREKSTMEFNIRPQTDYATYLSTRAAFETALGAVTDGVIQQRIASFTTRVSNEPSSDSQSAREKKAVIRYEDNVNLKQFVSSVPTLDDSAVTFIPNTDFLDLTQEPVTAFVTAFEAFAESPYGNGVNVISIERVGRNN